jgi:type 1 glutamine amidotransferase
MSPALLRSPLGIYAMIAPMKAPCLFGTIFLSLAICGGAQVQPPKKKLLAIGEVKGFEHDSVSHGLATLEKLGRQTGLWDTYIRTDSELITKQKLANGNAKNLNFFDAVVFYTTGDLGLSDQQKQDLLSFVRDDGKGFLGAHSATDTYYTWPEYADLIGGWFNEHPWGQVHCQIRTEDKKFPATAHFPAEFPFYDEIYQFKEPYSRDKVRVLMSVDPASVDLTNPKIHRTDQDFAVTWVRNYGKGRVFYSSLGHRDEVWDMPDIQKMWIEAVKWTMGMTEGDATPRPKPAQ